MGDCVRKAVGNGNGASGHRNVAALAAAAAKALSEGRCPLRVLRLKALVCNDVYFKQCLIGTAVVGILLGTFAFVIGSLMK